MQAWFDQQQQVLADSLDPTTNTVGHFVKQIYNFAEGGLASNNETSDMGLIQRVVNAAQKSTTGADSSVNSLDVKQGSYSNPAFLAGHYTQLGKFFGGTAPNSERVTPPQKSEALKSQDPGTFYARWYNSMRQFAEASEVAQRGQTTVRSR